MVTLTEIVSLECTQIFFSIAICHSLEANIDSKQVIVHNRKHVFNFSLTVKKRNVSGFTKFSVICPLNKCLVTLNNH